MPYFSGFAPIPNPLKDKLLPDGLPFYLAREPKPKAIIICLHGFFATPYEIRPIANACYDLGIAAIAPLLPCHGYAEITEQKQAVLDLTLENMLVAIRQEIAIARTQYEFVGLYGQSMGGALALAIASEGLVDAVATTAPALLLPIWARVPLFLLGRWKTLYLWNPIALSSYNPSYRFSNAHASKVLQQVSEYSRDRLSQVSCPVHVAHSHRDRVIDPIVCQWIESQATGKVTIEWFDRSDHTMPLDIQSKEVSTSVANFFFSEFAG
ncbi:alpha/beta fold hydrolase [Tumidithrix elongata RA019]|uniref:Alpha/beta fold hydrolase n=1 Tax=Tumidithrix elongata BACA0141 TaxID=2716417 RepID=A0AAW9Q3L9_9CYAN|nr:alpha/beta fold hydrolase [Tumidithrix elongata RA019]